MNINDDARRNERWSAIEDTDTASCSDRFKKLVFLQDFNFGRHNKDEYEYESSSPSSSHAMLIPALGSMILAFRKASIINNNNNSMGSLGSSMSSTISMDSFGSSNSRSRRSTSRKFTRYTNNCNRDSHKSLLSLNNNHSTTRWKSTPPPPKKKRSTSTTTSTSTTSHHYNHNTILDSPHLASSSVAGNNNVNFQGQRWAATVSSRRDSAAIDRPISAIQRKASLNDDAMLFHSSYTLYSSPTNYNLYP